MHLARHAKTWRPLYLLAPLDLKHKNNLLKWAKQLKLGNGLSILADVLVGSFNDLGDILRNRRVLPPVQRIFMALTNIEPKVLKGDAKGSTDKIEPDNIEPALASVKDLEEAWEDDADTTAKPLEPKQDNPESKAHDNPESKTHDNPENQALVAGLDILVETLIASKMSSGITQLLQSAGVGSMRPNMLIMPLKVWKDFQEDSTNKMTPEEYVELINNALTLRYGVGLLHVGDREGKSWEDEFVSKNDATAAELLCCGKRPTNTVERKFR